MSRTTCTIISSHKRGTSSGSWNCLLYIDGEATLSTMVRSTQEIDEVPVSKGEAYIGPPVEPVEHTRTDGKVGEVSVPTSQSFVREDVSGPGSTLASDSILGHKPTGVCGSTRKGPVSGRISRQRSDSDLPSYFSSAIVIAGLHKGDRFPMGCAIVVIRNAYTLHSLSQILATSLHSTHLDVSLPI